MIEACLRQLLNNRGDSEILKLEGSSGAEVYRAGNSIYKIGLQNDIELTFRANQRFKIYTPNCYDDIFPTTELSHFDAERSILEIEYCGSRNFEDLILNGDLSDEVIYNTVQFVHNATLQHLKKIFEESKLDIPIEIHKDSHKFVQELFTALRVNLILAGIASGFDNALEGIRFHQEKIAKNSVPSLAHKDLSVGNIVVSDDGTSVKFIDARLTVPQLNQTETNPALGNVAIDIIGYQISLLRKQLELRHSNRSERLSPLLNEVSVVIDQYIQGGVFSDQLKLLCEAVWYSVFSACKCNYCLAPERKWLYDLMVERTRSKIEELKKDIE